MKSEKLPKGILDWENHENHVAAIYRLLGYRVISNININGQQTDLLCEKLIPGAGKTVLYVECKHTEDNEQNSISKDTVNQFISNFHALKQLHGWTMGIMVSNRKFTQFAQSAAQSHRDIVLKTVDELYADLFQIQAYLHSCVHDYEADETFGDYIPLKAVSQSNPPLGDAQLLGELFDDWLRDSHSTQLCLLGDFGTGKTTFMRHVHHECARTFLAGDSVRMPLYIQLRDYFDARDGNELIERFFSLELATRVPHRIFDEFTRAGRFLLLLDGFDEMGVVSDSESRRRNYLKLNQLIRPNSKVIITCRPAYFVTHEELLDVFGLYKRQMGFSQPTTRGDKKRTGIYSDLATQLKNVSLDVQFRDLLAAVGHTQKHTTVAALELFDEKQVKAYLATQREKIIAESDGQLNDKSLLARMAQIYDLEDLAKRPILLKLIVSTLPLFKLDNTTGKYSVRGGSLMFDDITPSVLYYTYTEGELTREYEKGEIRWQIDRDERRSVIGEIAFHMFEADVLALEPATLSAIVALHFKSTAENLDQLVTDIRTCSFLTLDRNDYLRFAHKSFLEYYVAQHMVSWLQSKSNARNLLSRRILPDEIFYFLGDLIRSFYPSLLSVMHELSTALEDVCKCNALNLLNYAGNPRPFLENLDAAGLSYVKLRMEKLEFERSHLQVMRFVRSDIDELRLHNTNIEKLLLQGGTTKQLVSSNSKIGLFDCARTNLHLQVTRSQIKDLQLTDTVLENSAITDSTVILGPSYRSTLRALQFHNVLFMSADETHITKSQIHRVLFDKCIFLYMDFDSYLLTTATFRQCVFIRCFLKDGLALAMLKGSRGIFQYKGRNKTRGTPIEINGQPFLWNTKRAEEIVNFHSTKSSDARKSHAKLLDKLSWEDALAIAFPLTRINEFTNLTLVDVRKRLKDMEDKDKLATMTPLTPANKFSDRDFEYSD